MSDKKSFVEAGYSVSTAENGGIVVDGKGVNTGVRYAFTRVKEYLEFLCSQHTGTVTASQRCEGSAALADVLAYSPIPKILCDELADAHGAKPPQLKLRVGGVYEDGMGDR